MHEGILYVLRIGTDFYGFLRIYEGILYILRIFFDFYGFMKSGFMKGLESMPPACKIKHHYSDARDQTLRHSKKKSGT